MAPPIQAITFDIGDTITDLGEGRGDYEARLLMRAGHVYDVLAAGGLALGEQATFCAEFADFIEAYYQAALAEQRGVLIDEALARYFDRAQLMPDARLFEAAKGAYCNLGSTRPLALRAGARETLAALHRCGLRLAVISNTILPAGYLDAALARSGLLEFFPVRVYSSQLGRAKPHPAVFRAALAGLAVPAERAVHVGDRLAADVQGAQRVGMRAILIEVAHRPEVDPLILPEARIRELPELLTALAALSTDCPSLEDT